MCLLKAYYINVKPQPVQRIKQLLIAPHTNFNWGIEILTLIFLAKYSKFELWHKNTVLSWNVTKCHEKNTNVFQMSCMVPQIRQNGHSCVRWLLHCHQPVRILSVWKPMFGNSARNMQSTRADFTWLALKLVRVEPNFVVSEQFQEAGVANDLV